MSQVLSQQEIDSLLSALDTGEIDAEDLKDEEEEAKVRIYDFRRPIKLSKEYTNTLHMIFENFSKVASNFLTTQLRQSVSLTLGAVEQMSYDEFIRSIPKFTLLTLFNAENLSGTQMLEINPQFCIQAIDLLCGGSKTDIDAISKKDRFTDIEIGMLEEVVEKILKAFELAWSEIVETKTKIISLETNPQLGQSMSPNEPVILASFTVEIFKQKSFINIGIPYISFENILDKLSFRNWFDFEKEVNDESRDIIANNVMGAPVDIEVELGSSQITVRDFLDIELGDIIQLDTKSKDPLKLYVEDKLHFLVKPGKIEEKLGVEILQFIEEGEQNE